ncbi:MAG: glutamate--tRNA ligase [Bacteroidales bacterium]|jgi:glutamyl-tRNA synthetase|nr:glutamate--tRNA ligase [Bacteroidales bacterium]
MIRVRFAPSPTGPLHIGGVRTALFNYLFAKKHGGQFLLRIEDTDSSRFVPGAEEYIVEAFKWLGIKFDEGPHVGGNFSPYRQSERKTIYRKYVDELLAKGLAYYAFDTPEELDAMRARLEAEKSQSLQYDASTRLSMRNSLTMSHDEVKFRLDGGEQFVVRIKIEPNQTVVVNDLIRGEVAVNSSLLDDKVLWKSSDGLPTYHLANIVDDRKMQITHVIRGEEWLPSAPLHVLLYRYLGWEDTMPKFAHLPLLLKPDGNGKLSKRDGDKLGFPVFPLEWTDPKTLEVSSGYREMGYFPDAVINILALLGWNDGTEQEIFSLNELIEKFSLDRVSKHGAKFDVQKAAWFNHQYLMKKSAEELTDLFIPFMNSHAAVPIFDRKTLETIVNLVKERVNFVHEIWSQSHFFFIAPTSYDEAVVKKRWTPEMPAILENFAKILENETNFSSENLEQVIANFIKSNNYNMGQVMNCLRLCLVGAAMGPHLNDIMAIIGKEETLQRIRTAIEKI